MRIVPGRAFQGPVTPRGNVPTYTDNGFACFVLTMALFLVAAYGFGVVSPTVVYDHFAGLLGALNLFSLLFCVVLYVKGRLAPSSSDSGISGNPVFDYYWGTELFPRFLGWDVKRFVACRFGLMGWALIIVSFAAKQQDLHGLSDSMVVAAGLQLVYVAKFLLVGAGLHGHHGHDSRPGGISTSAGAVSCGCPGSTPLRPSTSLTIPITSACLSPACCSSSAWLASPSTTSPTPSASGCARPAATAGSGGVPPSSSWPVTRRKRAYNGKASSSLPDGGVWPATSTTCPRSWRRSCGACRPSSRTSSPIST